jgi:toxin-antitoxin system PIN domain toxin
MKVALLDTNVLLALAWPNHQHHAPAHGWFALHAKQGWATCAFTQLGFIRLSSNPAYTAHSVLPQEAAAMLLQWTRLQGHQFWASPTAEDPNIFLRAIGHQQVNDAWLVEVARRSGGRVVTFDTRMAAHSVEPGRIEVIPT